MTALVLTRPTLTPPSKPLPRTGASPVIMTPFGQLGVASLLRRHVYPDPLTPGRTTTGAPALGHRTLKELGKRPSLTQAWISGMKLSASSKGQVITVVSSVFIAAMDDGLIGRNPTRAQSVTRPKPD